MATNQKIQCAERENTDQVWIVQELYLIYHRAPLRITHNRLGTRQSKDRDEEYRLQHVPPLPTASHQPKSSVKTGQERAQIMLHIIKSALNQRLRSEAVHASADLTQNPGS